MKIGIDMMGGDYAPDATVKGLQLALKELSPDIHYYLFGNEELLKGMLVLSDSDKTRVHFIDSSEVIEMGDDPTRAFSSKRKSSMFIGFEYLATEKIDAFCSAGNSGAMLVGAISVIGVIPGIIRPCVTVTLPREKGGEVVLLDVGINPECKPEVLYQYGIMGSLFSKNIKKVNNPTVGLLNIGSEEKKGNLLTKATFNIMKESTLIDFKGNVEGYDLLSEDCPDVVVCDGFVGNVILKYTEGFYSLLRRRNLTDNLIENFNFEQTGGTPLLGVLKNVVLGHGISNGVAIKSMIYYSYLMGMSDLNKMYVNEFKNEKD